MYYMQVAVTDSNSATGVDNYTDWGSAYGASIQALYGVSAASFTPNGMDGYATDPVGGYPAILRAATAELWDVTHSPTDLAAFAFINQQDSWLATTGFAEATTWDINPTLLDGHTLQGTEIYFAYGGTTTATTADGLLAAISGNNVLNAGSGDSILIGGPGNDTLNGGGGANNYLFAGTGTQTLYAGPGTNYLESGQVWSASAGADTFVFKAADAATDTVVDFRPSFDTLQISAGSSGLTAASLLAGATTDALGDAVLHLSASHEVILQDVAVNQIDPTHIHIV
jgi:Ca2+-binding RTX toxin-like protein